MEKDIAKSVAKNATKEVINEVKKSLTNNPKKIWLGNICITIKPKKIGGWNEKWNKNLKA